MLIWRRSTRFAMKTSGSKSIAVVSAQPAGRRGVLRGAAREPATARSSPCQPERPHTDRLCRTSAGSTAPAGSRLPPSASLWDSLEQRYRQDGEDLGKLQPAELADRVRASMPPGRDVLLIVEDFSNDARLTRSRARGGYGLDAIWADDHHQVHVAVTGEKKGYYADHGGSARDLRFEEDRRVRFSGPGAVVLEALALSRRADDDKRVFAAA